MERWVWCGVALVAGALTLIVTSCLSPVSCPFGSDASGGGGYLSADGDGDGDDDNDNDDDDGEKGDGGDADDGSGDSPAGDDGDQGVDDASGDDDGVDSPDEIGTETPGDREEEQSGDGAPEDSGDSADDGAGDDDAAPTDGGVTEPPKEKTEKTLTLRNRNDGVIRDAPVQVGAWGGDGMNPLLKMSYFPS